MEKQAIIEQYIAFVIDSGQPPASVHAFTSYAGMEEKDFYVHFASFKILEEAVFIQLLEDNLATLEQDEMYQAYSIREKLLAFYFGFFEKALAQRSFFKAISTQPIHKPGGFQQFKSRIEEHFKALVTEGLESGEIPNRLSLHNIYPQAAWGKFLLLYGFWLKDESAQFEKTDEAIEKSVNLVMDLVSRNGLDSGLELGKFIFQQFKK